MTHVVSGESVDDLGGFSTAQVRGWAAAAFAVFFIVDSLPFLLFIALDVTSLNQFFAELLPRILGEGWLIFWIPTLVPAALFAALFGRSLANRGADKKAATRAGIYTGCASAIIAVALLAVLVYAVAVCAIDILQRC
jgi:hypothetical protein